MKPGTCATCRHWAPPTSPHTRLGECRLIGWTVSEIADRMAYCLDDDDLESTDPEYVEIVKTARAPFEALGVAIQNDDPAEDARLRTAGDFGCTKWSDSADDRAALAPQGPPGAAQPAGDPMVRPPSPGGRTAP